MIIFLFLSLLQHMRWLRVPRSGAEHETMEQQMLRIRAKFMNKNKEKTKVKTDE